MAKKAQGTGIAVAVLGAALILLLGSMATTVALAQDTAPSALIDSGWQPAQELAAAKWGRWFDLPLGGSVSLIHEVGGSPEDYAVEMRFRDDGPLGVHTRGYGGLDISGQALGVFWQQLTDETIVIFRAGDDLEADHIFVRIRVQEAVDYCSDWQSLGLGQTETFTHSLGTVDDLSVGLYFSSTVGINHRAYGGLARGNAMRGAYRQNLTATNVQVTRMADDPFAQQVRVCVNRPLLPDYDSGWQGIDAGAVGTFEHNLGGSPDAYVVRLDYLSTSTSLGINHAGAGGLFDATGANGAHWQNLTASTVKVHRQSDDVYADQVRVRMWMAERNIYLPMVVR